MNPAAKELLVSLRPWSMVPGNPWSRLRALLEKHEESEFGRAYGFSSIRNPGDFREALPPMDYEGHRHWIERAANGETAVLACDAPSAFERTSGTSSRAKWIPLTSGLREEFARGLASWFGSWLKNRPEVFEGKAYWAISPPGMDSEMTAGGLPVGVTNDAAYFPGDVGELLSEWLVIPDLSGDVAAVFEETAISLLATPDLSVVSVWSPTFLLGIDAAVRRLRGGLCWSEIWPKLAMVSCWADASSAPWIPTLQKRLGDIPIEPKGLLATEGITSVPDGGVSRLASECHWHEFLDGEGKFVEMSDLEISGIYEVLLTTSGGLFRYRSGDKVIVTGSGRDGLPRLRFIGRSGNTSDLAGEKLHERQVIEALIEFGTRGFLVANPERPGYDAWLEAPGKMGMLESLLRRNPYFDQAIGIRQLAPLRIHRLDEGWPVKLAISLAKRAGSRVGDVKLPALITNIAPEEVASWLA